MTKMLQATPVRMRSLRPGTDGGCSGRREPVELPALPGDAVPCDATRHSQGLPVECPLQGTLREVDMVAAFRARGSALLLASLAVACSDPADPNNAAGKAELTVVHASPAVGLVDV